VAKAKDYPDTWSDTLKISAVDHANGLVTFEPYSSSRGQLPASHDSVVFYDAIRSISGKDLRSRFRQTLEQGATKDSLLQKFLKREAPACLTASFKIPMTDARVKKLTPILLKMQGDILALQGPPGCGKTTLGGKLIAELLTKGKRIAVTSNSHRAIDLLLESALDHSDKEKSAFKAVKIKWDAEARTTSMGKHWVDHDPAKKFIPTPRPVLVGATCLDLSKRNFQNAFDYLFIDEASQVSVSYLLATHSVATNVVLLGDQMQLAQPIQATHPGESGLSLLEYYSASRKTLTPPHGLFLPDSFRMVPELSKFVSDLYYDSHLSSHPQANLRSIEGMESLAATRGVVHLPIEHEGNRQASLEEVDLVVKTFEKLIKKARFTDSDGKTRKLTDQDILVVAPYNHQVHLLKRAAEKAGYPKARIGTVDLFQGQEAAVVIVSMCNSADQEASRGTEFLFDPRRLNVALSRAQVLSLVIGHPDLAFKRTGSLREMQLINGYAKIVMSAGLGASGDSQSEAA
jgi:uncharacterized protein